jgi:DNA repair exonuclease SbcCD ATPase subunit
MDSQARITDTDALENLRSALIVFQARAKRSVDEVIDEVRRTKRWLEQEKRDFWEAQIRVRSRKLEQAEQELFNAKLSAWRDSIAREKAVVERMRALVAEAEEKLRAVKHWDRNYESTVEPLTKGLSSLREFLEQDLPNGIWQITNSIKALDAYAETRMPSAGDIKP